MRKIFLVIISIVIFYGVSFASVSKKIFEDIINYDRGKNVYASSFIKAKKKPASYYSPENILDKNKSTTWAVTNNKNGLNEYIIFDVITEFVDNKFPKKIKMNIVNGYAKAEKTFKENNRVKKAVLEIYEAGIRIGQDKMTPLQNPILSSTIVINLKDSMDQQQVLFDINLKQKIKSKYSDYMFIAKLIIKEIYLGTKYNDTCISEISFETKIPGLKSR